MTNVPPATLSNTLSPSARFRAFTIAFGRYMAYFFPTLVSTVRANAHHQNFEGGSDY